METGTNLRFAGNSVAGSATPALQFGSSPVGTVVVVVDVVTVVVGACVVLVVVVVGA